MGGTPCTAEASVDLDAHQAWLIDDNSIVRGPLPVSTGSPRHPTRPATFHVHR